jgi:hypothetical protein
MRAFFFFTFSCAAALSLLVALCEASHNHEHPDTLWERFPGPELQIPYNQVQYRWNGGELEVRGLENVDCFRGCSVDRCELARCFGQYFDQDGDLMISDDEMQDAIYAEMSWIERMATSDGKGWVKKFDGADGSERDHRISPIEVIEVGSDAVSCGDFDNAMHYLCKRAKSS